MRGATYDSGTPTLVTMFQSTPLMRGATGAHDDPHQPREVSIHAPHARGDFSNFVAGCKTDVSIHAPHARGDIITPINVAMTIGFNPRPSCEGRHLLEGAGVRRVRVSIHAPHARGDRPAPPWRHRRRGFNPRPSCEGRRRPLRGSRRRASFNPRPSCEGRQPAAREGGRRSMFQSTPLMRGATSSASG